MGIYQHLNLSWIIVHTDVYILYMYIV